MERQRAQELLSDYLDDELSDPDRLQVERCLQQDPGLREDLDGLRRTLDSLSRLGQTPPPSEFARKLEGKIRLRSRGNLFSARRAMRLPFEWFSFVIIIALLTWYLMVVLENRRVELDAKSSKTPVTEKQQPPHP